MDSRGAGTERNDQVWIQNKQFSADLAGEERDEDLITKDVGTQLFAFLQQIQSPHDDICPLERQWFESLSST